MPAPGDPQPQFALGSDAQGAQQQGGELSAPVRVRQVEQCPVEQPEQFLRLPFDQS